MAETASAPELTSPELVSRVEKKVLDAGAAVGQAMVDLERGVADEDLIAGLHVAMNGLTIAILDLDRLSRRLDRG